MIKMTKTINNNVVAFEVSEATSSLDIAPLREKKWNLMIDQGYLGVLNEKELRDFYSEVRKHVQFGDINTRIKRNGDCVISYFEKDKGINNYALSLSKSGQIASIPSGIHRHIRIRDITQEELDNFRK